MRRLIILGLVAAATPAAAFDDDGTVACRIVDKPAIERRLGASLGSLKAQAFDICAGSCDSVNASLCSFTAGPTDSWTVWAAQPPWLFDLRPSADDGGQDDPDHPVMIDWPGGIAEWRYDVRTGRGILRVYPNGRTIAVTVVKETGGPDSDTALGQARFIATRALKLFARLPENTPH